jgi:type VI secretion system protein ImpC
VTQAESIERLGVRAAALAEAVSLAVRIEPQLLRKMRIELFPSADAGVEADLWFSPVVESRAPSGIVLQQAAAQALRQRLGEKPAMLEAAWRVITLLHQNISPAIFAEERLAYLALAGRYQEMRELLRSVVATLLSPRGRGLAGWVARAIGRLPDEARNSEEAQMLAFGASLRLGESGLVDGAPPGRMAEWAAWLSPGDLETVPFGVALLEGAVEFGPAGRPRSHRIEFPKTMPVLVELDWDDGSRARTERVALHPQNLTIVEIPPGVTHLDIRTVLGDSYMLTVPAPRERSSLQRKLERARPPRVRISYDVEVGDAIEQKELPFVVGVMADLSGKPETPLPRLRDRKLVQIDQDNFDEVMVSINPHLAFQVDNRLEPNVGTLRVDLRFRGIVDFEPAQVVRQVKPLRELLEKRVLLSEMGALLTGNDRLENALEKILSSVARGQSTELSLARAGLERSPQFAETVRAVEDAAGVRKDRAEELVAAFVENVDFQSGSGELDAAAKNRIAGIDTRLSEQLREILHHPDFQALESTWRGLLYLVTQTETSTMLKIQVWNVNKSVLAKDFARDPEFDQSTIFKKLYEDQYGVFGGQPFGMLVGAYEFDYSPKDVELLENIAKVAAASYAPFLTAASAQMFGLESFASLGEVRDVGKIFDSREFARWKSFRDSEESLYVGLTLPRILLRLPYGRDTIPVEEFSFEEGVDGSDHSRFLWGSAAFALAARVTDAFARYSWCAAIQGVEGGGLVEGLPAYTITTEPSEVALKCPTEIAIKDLVESELSAAGFIPLVHMSGTHNAVFMSIGTVRKPRLHDSRDAVSEARLAGQLSYVFAVSRFAQYLRCMMRDRIGAFMSRDQCVSFLNNWIMHYVTVDDDASMGEKAKRPLRAARIDVEEVEGRSGAYRAVAVLQPHFQLDGPPVSLRVGMNVPAPAK